MYLAISYRPFLVILSFVMAIFFSIVSIDMFLRVKATSEVHRRNWMISGSIVMGIGIWTVHFIGMSAINLPISMQYNHLALFVSMICSVLASFVGLRKVTCEEISSGNVVLSGSFMGIGISAMHYVGMSANISIYYDPLLTVFSIVLATAISILAIWIIGRTKKDHLASSRNKLFAGFFLGIAICTKHYVGLAATKFYWHDIRPSQSMGNGFGLVEMGVVIAVFVILGLTIISATIDRQLEAKNQELQNFSELMRKRENQYRHLIEFSPIPIFVINSKKKVVFCNPQGFQVFGADTADHVIGTSIHHFLLPSVHDLIDKQLNSHIDGTIPLQEAIYRIQSLDGRKIDLSVSGITIELEGELSVLIMAKDITEQRKMAEKLAMSEARYRILHESLDHFSQELFKVMDVSELEERFISEIKHILKINCLQIIEVDHQLNVHRRTGDLFDWQEPFHHYFSPTLPIGKIVKTGKGCFVKIGEQKNKIYFLCIERYEEAGFTPQNIWLQTIIRYVSVIYENLAMIKNLANELDQQIEKNNTPSWLVRLLFQLVEKERIRLSADIHDSILQSLIISYRKIDSITSDFPIPNEILRELTEIEQGLLQAMNQTRMVCNYLRPPFLKELGLVKAVENLIDYTQKYADFTIYFNHENFEDVVDEEEMIVLYRVTQELLANAMKHSKANQVEFTLASTDQQIYFLYQDDGVGMELVNSMGSFQHLGLSGVGKRVQSIDGEIEITSALGKGVNVSIVIPLKARC